MHILIASGHVVLNFPFSFCHMELVCFNLNTARIGKGEDEDEIYLPLEMGEY